MLKTLFGQKYTKAFIDRVAWRKAQYYENRRPPTIRENATELAFHWPHEYPTGTPIDYIREDLNQTSTRADKVGIFSNIDEEQNIPVTKPTDRMDIIGQNGNDGLHYTQGPGPLDGKKND